MIQKRECTKCHKVKPFSSFPKSNRSRKGIYSWCKECVNKQQREKYHNDKSFRNMKNKANRASEIKRRFDISMEEYNKLYISLFNKQHGCCAICGKHQSELKESLIIDHNHNLKGIESAGGLLCKKCNSGIGLLNESPELCLKAYMYLQGDRKT